MSRAHRFPITQRQPYKRIISFASGLAYFALWPLSMILAIGLAELVYIFLTGHRS